MKNFILKVAIIFAVFSTQAWGLSKEVSKDRDFVRYCGQGGSYGSYDEIILTANVTLTSDITLKKNLKISSKAGKLYTINVANARQITIEPGYKLTLENVVFDGQNYSRRNEGLFYLNPCTDTNKIARLEMLSGAVIKNIYVMTDASADHAPIHIQKGGRFIMNDGAEILDCYNDSYHGNGGAICCDYGNVIINGGTISGCKAKGSGGAIRVTGARNAAEDHLGVAMRGDIFLYGGNIINNTCGVGSGVSTNCYGGGIYLGDTGPMLHVIGSVIVSNNVCRYRDGKNSEELVPDDVSTYLLEDDYANRLKLSGDTTGLVFTEGWIGVRYPDVRKLQAQGVDIDKEIQKKRFGGIWEYVTTSHEESRQFFWNGDNRYRGWINGNALVWTRYKIYQLPKDHTTVNEILKKADSTYPIYIEFNDGFIMDQDAYGDSHIRVPDGFNVIFDLQGHSITCNLEVANGGHVTFRDSSIARSGKVSGYRDVIGIDKDTPAYTNAYLIEGGSYHTKPDPAWVSPDSIVIENYCEIHPWMVAQVAWETNFVSRIADATSVSLETVDNEIREVGYNSKTGRFDIDEITFSTGDWTFNAHTNASSHVRVLAAPVASNSVSGVIEEVGPRVVFFDSGVGNSGYINNDNISFAAGESKAADSNSLFYGREDTFTWKANAYGLVKLMHVTYEKVGAHEVTNAVEQAYFRFPESVFHITQRESESKIPITLVEQVITSLGYNRADGFSVDQVEKDLSTQEANGLMLWENIVTGTATNELLLCTAIENDDKCLLDIKLCDSEKNVCKDFGFDVYYALRKSTGGAWKQIGETSTAPHFTVPLLDGDKSTGASGFYRVATLLVSSDSSITNEIPSTNIVGVLEMAINLTNSITAVPWVSLPNDPAIADQYPLSVSNYIYTSLLENGDSIQMADKDFIFRKWDWNGESEKWVGAITVTKNAIYPGVDADKYPLARSGATWVKRSETATRPLFLIGQYSSAPIALEINGSTGERPAYTLVPNPSVVAISANDYNWNSNPISGDEIQISEDVVLTWNGESWGRNLDGVWKADDKIPAGTGFWYVRRGPDSFDLSLPLPNVK